MTRRIFFYSFLTAAAALLMAAGLWLSVMYARLASEARAGLGEASGRIAAGMARGAEDYLDALPVSELRITWIASDGTVLFDSTADAAALENHGDREEVREALLSQAGTSERYSATLSETTFYYAQRLSDGTVLRVARTQKSALALAGEMLPLLLIVLAAAAALSAVLSAWAARRIVRPINAIDPARPDDGPPYDELAPLMRRLIHQQQEIAAQMEAVRHGEETMRTIVDCMSEGFLALDADGRVVSLNESAARLLRADRAAAPGQRLIVLHRGEALLHAAAEALAGRPARAEFEQDGRVIALFASPVRRALPPDGGNGGAPLTGAVLFLLDQTERARAEQLRREFSANVSHELKTPLTSISGYAELIAGGLAAPEDVPGFARRIQDEAARLLALIHDVMDLSRLDEGGDVGQWEDVELRALSGEVAARFDAAAAARGVRIAVAGCDAHVNGVRHVLDEIVYNLVDNAVRYNVPGGSVTVDVQDTPAGARLTVSDTGVGIPPEHQQKVFERFYRVDKSHARPDGGAGGTGLGLSIVKHGAALHGADLRLESEPGRGTAVQLLFPRP